jgi:hypothetical protein
MFLSSRNLGSEADERPGSQDSGHRNLGGEGLDDWLTWVGRQPMLEERRRAARESMEGDAA